MQNTNHERGWKPFLEGRYNLVGWARLAEQNIWVTVGFTLNRVEKQGQGIAQKYLGLSKRQITPQLEHNFAIQQTNSYWIFTNLILHLLQVLSNQYFGNSAVDYSVVWFYFLNSTLLVKRGKEFYFPNTAIQKRERIKLSLVVKRGRKLNFPNSTGQKRERV